MLVWNMTHTIFLRINPLKPIIMKIAEKRSNDLYAQLNLSPVTLNNYRSALNGRVLKEVLAEVDDSIESIFEITDLDLLWAIYTKVNVHPSNIKNHRGTSCAVMKYIRFLNNGKKIGKRIDFGKARE